MVPFIFSGYFNIFVRYNKQQSYAVLMMNCEYFSIFNPSSGKKVIIDAFKNAY